MKLLPTSEITINSKLEPNLAVERLSNLLEPSKVFYLFRWPFEMKPFKGKIKENNFCISTTQLVDASLKIVGEIDASNSGSQIKLTIKDKVPHSSKKVRLILSIVFPLIFGIMAYSFINVHIQNQLISFLLVSIFVFFSGGIIHLTEYFSHQIEPPPKSSIEKCTALFEAIFSENFSLPYEIPGFIKLLEKNKFNFENKLMSKEAGFVGAIFTMCMIVFYVTSGFFDYLPFLIIEVLFILITWLLGIGLYVLICWLAWKVKYNRSIKAQPVIQPDR